jgi:4-carboxymuconolactone decarboxylase
VTETTDWYAKGLQVLVDIGWNQEPTNINQNSAYVDQAFWNHTIENLWGRIWARPGLSLRDRQLVVLAVQTAIGSESGIQNHLKNCHKLGLTELEVRELIMQAGYYAGWPRFAETTTRFNRFLSETNSSWPESMRMELPERGEAPPPDDTDYFQLGLQTLRDLGWNDDLTDAPMSEDADQAFWDHTIENLWGRVYNRPGLSLRDRQVVVLAVLIYVDTDGITRHFENCHSVGLTEVEVREIIIQAGYYSGWPKFAAATRRFNRALNRPDSTWPQSARIDPAGSRRKGQPRQEVQA